MTGRGITAAVSCAECRAAARPAGVSRPGLGSLSPGPASFTVRLNNTTVSTRLGASSWVFHDSTAKYSRELGYVFTMPFFNLRFRLERILQGGLGVQVTGPADRTGEGQAARIRALRGPR